VENIKLKAVKLIGVLLLALPITVRAEQLVKAVSVSIRPYEVSQPQGADRMFVFASLKDASLETLDGNPAIWTELATGVQASGYNTFQQLNDGYCYEVKQGDITETVVVVDYASHRLKGRSVHVDITCSKTLLTMENMSISYYTDSIDSISGTYPRQTLSTPMTVSYMNQQWGEKDWEMVEMEDTIEWITPTVELDSILCDTKFVIREEIYSPYFYGEADSVASEVKEAVAVAHHQLYYIAKRGKTLENEKEGPYEDQTIIHSAPLDVLFESHPSAKADVYGWTIKRGKDIYTQRTDKDIRYIFDEASESGPVTYTIDLVVLNSEHPECVSTAQDTITLNSSFIMVPNVFTPNGDGVNDEFRVAYRSICEFHCWVYNRWQHLVYQWEDPTKGWDGTYNGRKEPDSAFIYIIDATGCDGQRYKLKGTVNLLRGK